MARKRRRYVRSDEIKLAERTPLAGELVLARHHGHKSYFLAWWHPSIPGFVRPTDTIGCIEAKYIMGWLPAAGNVSQQEIDKHRHRHGGWEPKAKLHYLNGSEELEA